jgi:hypothetical protein
MNLIQIQYSLCIKESIDAINPFTIKEPLELPPSLDGGIGNTKTQITHQEIHCLFDCT